MSTSSQDCIGYVPYVKEEEGFSDEDITLSHRLTEIARPVILNALDKLPIDGCSTFTFGDYGTADGLASMPIINELISILRSRHGDALPIQVFYEDKAENNYNSLVRRIHERLPGCIPSFLSLYENVFPLISPVGFHNACLPPESLDLGLSTAAMQYLRKLPCKMTGTIHPTGLTVPREKELFKKQAAQDWELILLSRASELKTGGHFVVQGLMDGGEKNPVASLAKLFEYLTNAWKDMLKDGFITEEEFHDANSFQYQRTIDEWKAPFEDTNSRVFSAGLRLVSVRIDLIMCPFRARWIKEGNSGDAKGRREHAQRFVSSIRYWTNWLFMSGLSTKRHLSEREEIVDELYKRLEDLTSRDPTKYSVDPLYVLLDIEKV